MLTKYLTAVTTAFSPFNPRSGKTARNFLALLPPNARQTMTIDVQLLGQAQKNMPATMALKFSELAPPARKCTLATERSLARNLKRKANHISFYSISEDGKEMKLDLEQMKIKEIQSEVNRHSRSLLRQEELAG